MNIIEPKAVYIPQENGIEGIYKQIEIAGRTCYHSEDKITEDSAKQFVDRMVNSKHGAMLEHGTVYLKDAQWNGSKLEKYKYNKYSKYNEVFLKGEMIKDGDEYSNDYKYAYYVTTNYRVLVENDWLDDLKYLCEPTEYHEKRYTIKFTTDIGVTREGNRHRVNSIGEESTRYCNYTKDKFGNEVSVIRHEWFTDEDVKYIEKLDTKSILQNLCHDIVYGNDSEWVALDYWIFAIATANYCYNNLIFKGWTPQQARTVLSLSTKSDIVYTAFESDWKHFIDLRLYGTTGKPHPDMEYLCEKLKEELTNYNLFDKIVNHN